MPGATPGHTHVGRILRLARVCLLQCRVPAFEPPRRLVDEILSTERRIPPWRRSGLQTLDALAEQTLAAAGLAAGDVPAAGAYVALRPIETTAWGGLDEDVSDRVHPENRRLAALAGKLLGLEIAGVDIMSPDIGQPWQANGAIINEVNYAPLLGGGEVSRARLPDLLRQLLPDGGRIPRLKSGPPMPGAKRGLAGAPGARRAGRRISYARIVPGDPMASSCRWRSKARANAWRPC